MSETVSVRFSGDEAGALIDTMVVVTRFGEGVLLDSLVELRGEAWRLAFVSAACALFDAINRQHLLDGEVALRLGVLRAQLDQLRAEGRAA